MNRRDFLILPFAMTAMSSTMMPKNANGMDPLSITLALIGVISSIWEAKIYAESATQRQKDIIDMNISIEKMRQDFERWRISYAMGSHPVSQETLYDGRNEAAFALSENIDGYGTALGVNGRIGSARGKYNGEFSTAEAKLFGSGMKKGMPMPVPTEEGYHSFSASQVEKRSQFVPSDNWIIGGRRFSSARKPTSDGWDLETIIYANSQNEVKASLAPRIV